MLISFQVDSSQGGQVALNPSDISVWADSSIMTYSADVVAILHGNTSVATKISGSSSGEYTLLPSPNTPHLLLVQSAQEPPPVPHVTSVTFANDAASVVVVFSGNTDRGGRNNALFSCSLLLSFVDADSSQCQWGSHKRLSIYPPASVGVDDVVVVVADSIRAECTVSNTPCQQWATVVPDPAGGAIASPVAPVAPVVTLTYPTTIGACNGLVLDLSGSSGSGGRPWDAPQFTVQTTPPGIDVTSLQAFLNTTYTISPPSVIAADLLVAGSSYTISVTMCNFLGGCASNTAFMQVASASSVPVVSFQGGTAQSVNTGDPVLVALRAYTSTCAGATSSANLTYRWSVYQFGEYEVPSLVSQSVDPKKFKLPGYSLEPGTWYSVRVQVTHTVGGVSSDAFATMTLSVERGSLVPVIVGGAQQSLRLGELLELDGSQSYDQDIQGQLGSALDDVEYTWACVQLEPVYSTACPFELASKAIDGSVGIVDARNVSSGAGSKARVSLTAASETRSATREVELTLVDALAPVVQVQNVDSLVDPSTVLRIRATVTATVPCSSQWNVSGDDMGLAAAALTPTAGIVPSQATLYPVFLALDAGVLAVRSSYRFTLACGASAASVDVTTNGPPQYGIFSVSPASGVGRDTVFSLRTHSWFDAHTPLFYQFEHMSPVGARVVLQGRSRQVAAAVALPAGASGSGFNVTCLVRALDSLGASSTVAHTVTVNPAPEQTINQISAAVATELSLAVGSLDSTHQVIGAYGSALNTVDCSTAPNCGGLNRQECGSHTGACGPCLDGFLGDTGSGNGVCLSASDLVTAQSSPTTPTNKTCPGDCSDQGVCGFVDSRTLKPLTTCPSNVITCSARCTCGGGFSGDACDLSTADMSTTQEVRSSLIANLLQLTTEEEPDTESVVGWVTGAVLLSEKDDEMTIDAAGAVLDIATAVISAATTVSASFESVRGVLDVVDSASRAIGIHGGNRSATMARSRDVLNGMGTLVMSAMVAGEAPFVSTLASTKLSSQVSSVTPGGLLQLSVPQSELEAAYQTPTTTLAVDMGNSSATQLATTLTESNAFQFGDDSDNFASNPLNIQLQVAGAPSDLSFIIIYQNLRPIEYPTFNEGANITTECDNTTSTTTQYCPGDVEVVHRCTGTPGTLWTPCPAVVVAPACQTIASAEGGEICSVVNFTASTTTCLCKLSGAGIAARRRMGSGESMDSFQAVTIVESIYDDFTTTLSTVPTSEKEIAATLAGSVIVITMFGAFWFGGFALMAYFQYKHTDPKKRKVNPGNTGAMFTVSTRHGHVNDAMTESIVALRDYVEMLMPPVYAMDVPLFSRMKTELMRSHKFCRIFTPVRSEADRRDQVLNSFQIITTETIFLFTIALCYDIESPSDDGSCLTFSSESACLARKSVTDDATSYCEWDPTAAAAQACSYSEPRFSIQTTVLVASIVGVIVTLLDIPVSFLFELVASPTTTLTNQVKHTVAAGVRKARRASAITVNAARSLVGVLPGAVPVVPSAGSGAGETASAKPQSGFTFIQEYVLSKDIISKRKRAMGRRGAAVAAPATCPEAESQAQALSLTKTDQLLNSGFMQRQVTVRDLLWTKRNALVRAGKRLTQGVPKEFSDRLGGFLTDMTLHLEKLQESDFRACVEFMRSWNFTVVLSEDGFVESAEAERQASGYVPALTEAGLNPTNMLRKVYLYTNGKHSHHFQSNRERLAKEMARVGAEAEDKAEMLVYSGEAVVGMSILHEFILDILGRNTPCGKIFARKTEMDFKRMHIVSVTTKYLAGAAIMCVNLFCLFYAILKGYSRGVAWQQQFLVASILQLLVEIFVFETLEVLWRNVVVPQFAVTEVHHACVEVLKTINKFADDLALSEALGGAGSGQTVGVATEMDVFNSSDYFFVSKQLARAHPSTIESKIVTRYESTGPTPELHERLQLQSTEEDVRWEATGPARGSDEDPTDPSWGVLVVRWLRYFVTSVLFFVIQISSSMPSAVQDIVLAIVQPCLLGAVGYFVYLCLNQPLLFLGFLVVCLGAYLFVRFIERVSMRQHKNHMAPEMPDVAGLIEAARIQALAEKEEVGGSSSSSSSSSSSRSNSSVSSSVSSSSVSSSSVSSSSVSSSGLSSISSPSPAHEVSRGGLSLELASSFPNPDNAHEQRALAPVPVAAPVPAPTTAAQPPLSGLALLRAAAPPPPAPLRPEELEHLSQAEYNARVAAEAAYYARYGEYEEIL